MKAIVFGGTGFIGSHVVEQLILSGHTVTVAARETSDTRFLDSLGVNTVRIDFSNTAAIKETIEGHEVVYNCTAAAKVSTKSSLDAEVEINLTRTLIEQAALAKALRFIQLSTIMVYDFQTQDPMDESYIPQVEYPIQEIEIQREKIVEELGKKYGIETFILRPASTIGSRDRASFFSNFFSSHKNDNYVIVDGGNARVSLVDTRDIGRAMVWLGTYKKSTQDNGIFVLKGFDTTWTELKDEVDKVTGRIANVTALPKEVALTVLSPFEVNSLTMNRVWNDDKIKKCGFSTKYSLTETLENAVRDLENLPVQLG
ncbi:epimerase [Bacillus cereus]|uniref:NAD-dependent epimerase/dehydratase family protein n=1 Tax=Bacillus TaxID=1386 RepID=UPI0006AD6587|nr:NAD(P)-dependent oxidoreductase [Bacillus cereus]PAW43145.1 NAD(P)-dependent oxidoreductase [Bacillus toyonensis]HDR7544214.1 NAD(P)-dependent oxidoreductase [Bacillus thuringiensis]ALC54721.1 epimerase [Bacillus cereus]PAW45363.1 NAD(P)-dependent oxidoreductase [Bacillus toyonensis]PEL99144.1 NAD(P)-dependent oxidoreductase [Bacillus cereus]